MFRLGQCRIFVVKIFQIHQNSVHLHIHVAMIGKNQINFIFVRMHRQKIVIVMWLFLKITIHMHGFYVMNIQTRMNPMITLLLIKFMRMFPAKSVKNYAETLLIGQIMTPAHPKNRILKQS